MARQLRLILEEFADLALAPPNVRERTTRVPVDQRAATAATEARDTTASGRSAGPVPAIAWSKQHINVARDLVEMPTLSHTQSAGAVHPPARQRRVFLGLLILVVCAFVAKILVGGRKPPETLSAISVRSSEPATELFRPGPTLPADGVSPTRTPQAPPPTPSRGAATTGPLPPSVRPAPQPQPAWVAATVAPADPIATDPYFSFKSMLDTGTQLLNAGVPGKALQQFQRTLDAVQARIRDQPQAIGLDSLRVRSERLLRVARQQCQDSTDRNLVRAGCS